MGFNKQDNNNQQDREVEDGSDIGSVENLRSGDQQFSHQALVRNALNKCFDRLSQEGKSGILEEVRIGNTVKIVHKPDARLEAFNSIDGAIAIMSCDFDDEANQKIDALLNQIVDTQNKWIKIQQGHFAPLSYESKQNVIKEYGCNPSLPFLQKVGNIDYNDLYLNDCVHLYMRIFKELNRLTKRIDFYKGEILEQ
jgi:hypothetical protein